MFLASQKASQPWSVVQRHSPPPNSQGQQTSCDLIVEKNKIATITSSEIYLKIPDRIKRKISI